MKLCYLLCAASAALSLTAASVSRADTVYADWTGIQPGLAVKIHADGPEGFLFNGAVWTGVNNWTVKGGADAYKTTSDYFKAHPSFDAFCIEIRQHLQDPTMFNVTALDVAPDPDYPANGPTGMGSDKADDIRKLWGTYFDQIHIGSVAIQNENAAAFQLAIWDIVYDTDYNVTTAGHFNAISNSMAVTNAMLKADEWLGIIRDDNQDLMLKADLIALTNVLRQDMVTVMPTPAAAGIGLLCFGGLLLRRNPRLAS